MVLGDEKGLQANTQDYRFRVLDFRIIFSKDDRKLFLMIV